MTENAPVTAQGRFLCLIVPETDFPDGVRIAMRALSGPWDAKTRRRQRRAPPWIVAKIATMNAKRLILLCFYGIRN